MPQHLDLDERLRKCAVGALHLFCVQLHYILSADFVGKFDEGDGLETTF